MELVRKIGIFFLLVCLTVFTGCGSVSNIEDPLVLTELTPFPKDVKIKKQVLYEPVYGIMKVLEISSENGVQTELMAKKGNIESGIEENKTGEISESSDFSDVIGTFKIVTVQNGFLTCKIENLTRKIPSNAYIRVQIGQKVKEE